MTTDDPAKIAELTARALLDVGAIHLRPHEPFTFTSGLKSPVYVDIRKLISYPRLRTTLMDWMVARLYAQAGFERFDAVAGGETAGIPFAAWIAERMGLPMLYVRKKPKGFGRNARIEGDLREGARTLLVEDLATDGGSKIGFAEALREAGAECSHASAVYFYDVFPEARDRLAEAGLRLHALTTWRDVLALCRKEGRLDAAALKEAEGFAEAPREWSAARGGPASS